MHLRITWGRVKPGQWQNYESTYRRVVLDDQRSLSGLRGRLLFRDCEDPDSGGTLSLWDSAEDARAYEEGELRQAVLPQLEPFFSGEFVTHVCEIRAGELRAG